MSLKENKNIVYFLGAGFTKAMADTAPVGNEFFKKAFNPNAHFIEDKKINNVKQFIEDIYYPLESEGNCPAIEDVLSLIDYVIQRKEALSRKYLLDDLITVRNNLIYLIGTVIKKGVESPQNNLGLSREFISLLAKQSDSRISIISSNYDIIIDNALLEKANSCNYGIRLRYNLEEPNWPLEGRPHESEEWVFLDGRGLLNKGNFQLLKIHGSLNWLYCPKCDELDITIGVKGSPIKQEEQSKYLCVNKFCTSNYEPLLVTPTMLKIYSNTFLRRLWTLAEEEISKATELILIGYSLPAADYHIRSLIPKAFAKNKNSKRPKITVVEDKVNKENKERIEEVKERYTMLFGKNFEFLPIGFKGYLETHLASQTHHPLS